jgi:hypothetical protein
MAKAAAARDTTPPSKKTKMKAKKPIARSQISSADGNDFLRPLSLSLYINALSLPKEAEWAALGAVVVDLVSL